MRRLPARFPRTPTLVLGRRLDVPAWNRAAVTLYTGFAAISAARRRERR
jgi:hypothetical protein